MSFLYDLLEKLWPKPKPPKPPVPPSPPLTPPTAEAQELLARHNQERAANHLPPLVLNDMLSRAAMKHANWMAANRTLDHSEHGVTFDKRLSAEGYHFWSAGENIGLGQSPQSVMTAWMNSPKHRTNILKAGYKEVGFGVGMSGESRYWCVDFGSQSAGMGMESIHEPGVSLSGPLGPVVENWFARPAAEKPAIDHLT